MVITRVRSAPVAFLFHILTRGQPWQSVVVVRAVVAVVVVVVVVLRWWHTLAAIRVVGAGPTCVVLVVVTAGTPA